MSSQSSRSSSSSMSSTPGSGYNTDDTEVSSRGNPESRRGSYGPTLDNPCPLKRNTYCSKPLASLFYFSTQNHLDVLKNEKALFKIRREADLWKTVYKFKKNVLGSQALSALNERWEDLKNTALQIEASLGTDAEGSCIEMKTAPLLLSSYVQDEEISQIHTTFKGLQRFRNGKLIPELKKLKRPSRSSGELNGATKEFDSLVSRQEEYAMLVQEFADTTTPEEFCQWPNKGAVSGAKRQEKQVLVDLEEELRDKINDFKSKHQSCVISTPSYGAYTSRRGRSSIRGSRVSATCRSGQTSMGGSRSSATCVY